VKLLGRLLLVVALLFSQAGGVAHEIWHASSLAADADGEAKTPKGNPLCDFHTALSAVLGAVDGGSHAVVLDVQSAIAFARADASAIGLSAPTPRSRAPPALL
jgi:hypothetical protein